MRRFALVLVALAACQPTRHAAPTAPAATSAAIAAGDLKTRLFAFAADSMQGRKSGTPGNVRATDYLAREAERIGLEPTGENGSFFQTVPLVDRVLDLSSALTVDGTTLEAWDDMIPRDQGKGARPLDGVRAIYAGIWADKEDRMISPEQAAGKLVVVTFPPTAGGTPTSTVNRAVTTARFATAAGIAVATLDDVSRTEQLDLESSGAALGGAGTAAGMPAFLYVTSRAATALLGANPSGLQPGALGKTVSGDVRFTDRPASAPARNVVALLRGSDPALRGQIVAIGAHNDHVGMSPVALDHDSVRAYNRVMRPEGANDPVGVPNAEQLARIRHILDSLRTVHPPRADSIFNGADDDGSGSVGVLEIAESLAAGPRPKRSVLFVWHTAEELGLLGSDWFTRYPTVPRDSIVAQLNIDMIGRGEPDDVSGGGPGYLQMIGSQRLSTELGELVERINRELTPSFRFDYSYDADGNPANYYCRSDHYMYARFGIPIAFFSSGSHRDYHQLTDEPQYIDYDKMAHVSRLVTRTALEIANADHRIAVDKPKPDPEAACRQ